jgi:hypothetical protein
MAWPVVKTELLARHAHAFEHADEVRLVLAFGEHRVTTVVRPAGEDIVVIAEVTRDAAQIQSLLREAVGSTVPFVTIGDALYLRVAIVDDAEAILQKTARAALRLRARTTTDPATFAFAL